MSAYKFEFYCGMTCYGGSEQKECPCTGPATCELKDDPHYPAERGKARARMFNLLARGIPALNKREPAEN